MGDLKNIISVLDTLMKESEEILDNVKGKGATARQQLQARSEKLHDQNLAYQSELVGLSHKIFRIQEYYDLVHPMWGAIDATRKLFAMNKPAQASKMLEKAQSVWEKEVFTFDLDDFPKNIQNSLNKLVGQIDQLFVDSFAAISAGDDKADASLRKLLGKTDNLFDVCDDSLDDLLENLKAN